MSINYDQKLGAEKLYKRIVGRFCDAKAELSKTNNMYLVDMFESLTSMVTREMVEINKEFDEFDKEQGVEVGN